MIKLLTIFRIFLGLKFEEITDFIILVFKTIIDGIFKTIIPATWRLIKNIPHGLKRFSITIWYNFKNSSLLNKIALISSVIISMILVPFALMENAPFIPAFLILSNFSYIVIIVIFCIGGGLYLLARTIVRWLNENRIEACKIYKEKYEKVSNM